MIGIKELHEDARVFNTALMGGGFETVFPQGLIVTTGIMKDDTVDSCSITTEFVNNQTELIINVMTRFQVVQTATFHERLNESALQEQGLLMRDFALEWLRNRQRS